MRKSQTTTINAFLLSLFYIEKLYFFSNHISRYLVYIITFVLQFFRMAGNWKCNNKTPTPQQICIGLVDTVLRPRVLGYLAKTRYLNIDFDSN